MLSGLGVRCGFTVTLNLMCTWVGTGLLHGLAGAAMENYSGWSYAQHSLTDCGGWPKWLLCRFCGIKGGPPCPSHGSGQWGNPLYLAFPANVCTCGPFSYYLKIFSFLFIPTHIGIIWIFWLTRELNPRLSGRNPYTLNVIACYVGYKNYSIYTMKKICCNCLITKLISSHLVPETI